MINYEEEKEVQLAEIELCQHTISYNKKHILKLNNNVIFSNVVLGLEAKVEKERIKLHKAEVELSKIEKEMEENKGIIIEIEIPKEHCDGCIFLIYLFSHYYRCRLFNEEDRVEIHKELEATKHGRPLKCEQCIKKHGV